eukprot:9394971-Alexandrium_andersonii.AAC.1
MTCPRARTIDRRRAALSARGRKPGDHRVTVGGHCASPSRPFRRPRPSARPGRRARTRRRA